MTLRRAAAAAVVLLALPLAACGTRLEAAGISNADGASDAASDATEAQSQADASSPRGPDGGATEADSTRGSAATDTDPVVWPSGPSKDNTMRLEVSLSHGCVQPGSTLSATATTARGARLAFATRYSDNNFVPDIKYVPGEANPTGTFTWTWQITPTHPRGEAGVIVVAAKGDRGASYDAPFVIADRC